MSLKTEARKNLRHACYVPVDGMQDATFGGLQTVDIGVGGIGFVASHSIPVGEKIAVELELTLGEPPVLVQAQVKWVRRISESDSDADFYRIGMRFIRNLAPDSTNRLKDRFIS